MFMGESSRAKLLAPEYDQIMRSQSNRSEGVVWRGDAVSGRCREVVGVRLGLAATASGNFRERTSAALWSEVCCADFADLGFSDFADAASFRICGTYSAAVQCM